MLMCVIPSNLSADRSFLVTEIKWMVLKEYEMEKMASWYIDFISRGIGNLISSNQTDTRIFESIN